jgi:hypothetical protein
LPPPPDMDDPDILKNRQLKILNAAQVGISTLGLDGILYLLGVRDREAMDQEQSRSARL